MRRHNPCLPLSYESIFVSWEQRRCRCLALTSPALGLTNMTASDKRCACVAQCPPCPSWPPSDVMRAGFFPGSRHPPWACRLLGRCGGDARSDPALPPSLSSSRGARSRRWHVNGFICGIQPLTCSCARLLLLFLVETWERARARFVRWVRARSATAAAATGGFLSASFRIK